MKNVTELEMNILSQMARQHYGTEFNTEDYGDEPAKVWAHVDTWINFSDLSGDSKQLRGALSSLIQKGLVRVEEIWDGSVKYPDCFFMSELAYNIAKGAA